MRRFHVIGTASLMLAVCNGVFVFGFSASERDNGSRSVRAGASSEEIERTFIEAAPGSTIYFEPGKYLLTKGIELPCKGLTITGPNSTPPTATLALASSARGQTIFALPEGCQKLGAIRYIHFENSGAVYVGANSANFKFEHNVVTHLPSSIGGDYTVTEAGVFLDGSLFPMTTTRHIAITDNTFGDASSCTAVFSTDKDEGGNCAGVITHTGLDEDLTISRNQFVHLEEGIHLLQLATYKPGDTNSGCLSCVIEYNSVVNYHRIGIEIQVHTRDTMLIRHNSVIEPLGAYYGTFAVSLACCLSGPIQGTHGYSPSLFFDDNVLIASTLGYQCPPYGVEFWGMGAQGTNNLVEGQFCNGFTWGYGDVPWSIKNNYICGPNYVTKGGYISNQQHQNNPPSQAGNSTEAKCSARRSPEPTIYPRERGFAKSALVTLGDSGPNTSVWYTTDGSLPVPGSGTTRLYVQPFAIEKSTVIKAIGMWGAPNQPLSYPTGFGYVPSRVVTASFVAAQQR